MSQCLKILHILNHVKRVGNGIANVAVDLACLQARSGHQVAVASAGGDYELLLASYGVKHFELNQARKPIQLLKAIGNYRHIIQTFQPDIVHAHMMTGMVLSKVLEGNSNYGLVSTVHNEFQRSAILMGWADRVIAVSQAVETAMIKRGVSAQKLRVVCNGTLGSPRSRPISDYQPLNLHRPAITTVAGMYHRKGIRELIDAFVQIARDFPPVHLYLVGDGPDKAEFVAQAQQTPFSDRIHFEGFQSEPQRYLRSSDIFVLASRREPFGLAIIEAREAGCAIVATQIDGIPEALEGGKAGILVPPQDSQSLADALRQLLSQPEQLKDWQQQAQQNLDHWTVQRVHQQTLDIYQELIGTPLKKTGKIPA